MKSKTKYFRTRRLKAIRRGIAVILLFFFLVFCHYYGFFPSSALREAEEHFGTGKTEILVPYHNNADLKFTGLGRACLSENENAMIHNYAKFNVLIGWYRAVSAALDCSAELPVHAGWHSISGSESGNVDFYFGQVDEGSIASVALGRDFDGNGVIDDTVALRLTESEDIRYFYDSLYDNNEYYIPYILAYDSAGGLIYQARVEQGASSYIG